MKFLNQIENAIMQKHENIIYDLKRGYDKLSENDRSIENFLEEAQKKITKKLMQQLDKIGDYFYSSNQNDLIQSIGKQIQRKQEAVLNQLQNSIQNGIFVFDQQCYRSNTQYHTQIPSVKVNLVDKQIDHTQSVVIDIKEDNYQSSSNSPRSQDIELKPQTLQIFSEFVTNNLELAPYLYQTPKSHESVQKKSPLKGQNLQPLICGENMELQQICLSKQQKKAEQYSSYELIDNKYILMQKSRRLQSRHNKSQKLRNNTTKLYPIFQQLRANKDNQIDEKCKQLISLFQTRTPDRQKIEIEQQISFKSAKLDKNFHPSNEKYKKSFRKVQNQPMPYNIDMFSTGFSYN